MRSLFRAANILREAACARLWLPVLLALGLSVIAARADDITAEANGYTDHGFGRLQITFSKEVKAKVRVVNGILIVDFGQPVQIAVNQIVSRLPGYVSAVRRDPDMTAIRLALSSKVTVNVQRAAEKLFVDLLPENWVGLPPGLPPEVVEQLAQRALAAERQAKMERAGPKKTYAPVKLHFASAPTFSRFGFEMSEPMKVAAERDGQELRITFDAPVKVEFGEVFAKLPAGVVGLDADYQPEVTIVRLVTEEGANVRTFQENAAFVADVTPKNALPVQDIEGAAKKLRESSKQPAKPDSEEPAKDTLVKEAAKAIATAAAASAAQSESPKELEAVAPETKPASKPDAAMPAAPAVTVVAPAPTPASMAAPAPALAPAMASEPAPKAAPIPVPSSAPSSPADARSEAPAAKPIAVSSSAVKQSGKSGSLFASITRQVNGLTINFPFNETVAGALFRRGGTTFIVLDTTRNIGLSDITTDPLHLVKSYEQSALPGGQLIKLKIDANRLVNLVTDETGWTIQIGGATANPSRPIPARRVFAGQNRAGVFIPLGQPHRAYGLKDPEVGDELVVVTASSPARGLVRSQKFVDFNALATVHGVVLAPKADDLTVELSLEGVTVTRPQGLSVSEMDRVAPALPETSRGAENASTALDPDIWAQERKADFGDRQAELARALAESPAQRRMEKRLTLARFYLARDLPASAVGVLEANGEGEEKYTSDPSYALLHGFAELLLARPQDALRDFNNPVLVNSPQAAVLRASALAGLSRWAEARDQFNSGKNAVASFPVEVQRTVLIDAMRAMINANDFAAAGDIRGEIDVVGVPSNLRPEVDLLAARLAAGLGRLDQASYAYSTLADGPEGPAMAEAKLRLVEMRMNSGDFDRQHAIDSLETLSFVWRGGETELETMRLLGKLYVSEQRYRAAFNLLDSALLVQPDSNVTRSFYNEMAAVFEDLFLSDRANSIEPIEALALYYDFSKLTPIGRRGDEMIRRLADRLVSVDLLDQAAELLDYQLKYRLTGVAKAQVAARLAFVRLLGQKPQLALQALSESRVVDLPQEIREQRLMLEARALSETGRPDAALELTAGISGPEADRLRGDILWAAKRWREAGEAYEKILGPRWQDPQPLNETERRDVLRAAFAFTLGRENMGLARLRDRYAAKMPESAERTALGIVTSSGSDDPKKLTDIAKTLSAADSLRLFLRLYQARYPERPLPPDDTQKVSAR